MIAAEVSRVVQAGDLDPFARRGRGRRLPERAAGVVVGKVLLDAPGDTV